jgi:Bacterial self-protective colicin-like immunity
MKGVWAVADSWWERERWAVDLVQYVILIRAFLEGRLTGGEFQMLYLAAFKSDNKHRPSDIFSILDGLFADIDNYCSDDVVRQRVGGIDEEELRARTQTAEARLSDVATEHV